MVSLFKYLVYQLCTLGFYVILTQILGSTSVFNIDNNHKCFLSSKSVYYYDL